MKYKIIRHKFMEPLEKEIEEYLKKGYELHGRLLFDDDYFYQVVIKK